MYKASWPTSITSYSKGEVKLKNYINISVLAEKALDQVQYCQERLSPN